MTIPSNVSVSLWVNEGLLAHSPSLLSQPGSFGSVVFRFTSPSAMNLYAAAVPSIHGEPIAFPIPAHPAWQPAGTLPADGAGSLEGIWWQPRSGLHDVLIISNTSERKVSGTLSLFDASGKRWSGALVLAARQTQRLAMSDLLQKAGLGGSYGGISFEAPASASAVEGVHFLYDETSKFSAFLEMFSRDPNATLQERAGIDVKQWTMRAPMLALRAPDPAAGLPAGIVLQPMILVRNTTAKNISADASLSWHSDSARGQVKLPEMQLAPFATQQLRVGAMQKQLGIPDTAHWAMVSLATNASPDDLIAIASSRDASGRYGFETRFIGGSGGYFAGGEWRYDANHNQIISVTNSGIKPTDALLTLHYDNGQKKYEMQQTIQPGDQMWVNLAQLVRQRIPDRKGNTLPVDVSGTTYDLQDLSPGGHSLTIGELAVGGTWGVQAVQPPCPECCGQDVLGFSPSPVDLATGDTDTVTIDGIEACNGDPAVLTPDFTVWGSDNTAVAKVSYAKVQGVAVGSTTGYANGLMQVPGACGCNFVPAETYVPITVVGPPDHLVVVTDNTTYPNNCPSGTIPVYTRQMQMQVVDAGGNPITNGTSIQEGFSNTTSNTCPGGGLPAPASCASTDTGGTFIDSMTVAASGCVTSEPQWNNCGYSLTSTWSTCGGSGSKSLWVSQRVTHSQSISVDGATYAWPKGTSCGPNGC